MTADDLYMKKKFTFTAFNNFNLPIPVWILETEDGMTSARAA